MTRRLLALVVVALMFTLICGCDSTNTSPNEVLPAISHTKPGFVGGPPPSNPTPGDVLYTSSGQWSGSPTGFTYLWEDCNSSGASCTTAAGSPTNTQRYQIVSGDGGFTIRVAVTASYSGHPNSTVLSAPTGVVSTNEFPLAVSSNGRFLQTAAGTPFLMVGDSPQSLIGNLTEASADSYFTDRVAHGFNTLWINLLCDDYTFCSTNGKSLDGSGTAPFTSGSGPSSYNIALPSSSYFATAHAIIADAEADGLEVMLDPVETGACQSGGWMDLLANNGNGTATSGADFAYGQYLGTTFGDLNNIIWISGNDFQCIGTTADNNDAQAVANGIHNTDPSALETLESDECGSPSCSSSTLKTTANASTGWSSIAALNGTYGYNPSYAAVNTAFGQTTTQPVFMEEANYDGEALSGMDGGTDPILRNQEWWTMTSGAAGDLYGCGCTDRIAAGWTTGGIDTTGVQQLGYQTNLLNSIDWQNLVPDTSHTLVTSGTGTCPTTGLMASVNCVTAALDSASKVGLIYDPQDTSFTVAMSKFATTNVVARWYDPTTGTYSNATGTPFANTGSHTFTPTGTNNAGDNDWVLLLQAP